ncbi:YdeI/OmpD-associated family protein [Kitasatospora albolonga]|uniref:YdeI/OmpD-associated family protein n=1 Tax=Kitasatospora albolonga TaxID=68173 RepID=UPI0031EF48B0
MEQLDGVEVIAFADGAAFEGWLTEHHGRVDGVWVKVAKKGAGVPSVTEQELVDVGLCWGWVSGQRRSLDGQWYLQRYVPRRPRSLWSLVNVEKVAELTAAGRMREPGLAEVRRAQQDGRWAGAYPPASTAVVPPELAAALAEDPAAAAAFEGLDRTARYQLMLPLLQALTPKSRASRLERALRQLGAG